EHQEGNFWEAAMFAGNCKLVNLTAIVDRNNIQIDDRTEQVMPLEPLRGKDESCGWHVREIDGNDVEAGVGACAEAGGINERPTAISAYTIPGKGVDFMEFDYHWHSKEFAPGEARKALDELRSLGGRITGEHQ